MAGKAILVKENGEPRQSKRYYDEAEETIKNNLANEIKLNELRTTLVSTYRMNSEHLMTTIRTSAELI
jgi:hypothetical protein